MNKKTNGSFARFVQAEREEYTELREEIRQGGYSAFNEILEGLRTELTKADESGISSFQALLAKAREVVPEPGQFSPSWELVWDDMDQYVHYKEEAMKAVPADNREGEWQIVMDNPFTNEGIACYPGLSFVEAAYLYAYFRKDLKKTEYIRLQKVIDLILTEGE